MRAIYLIARREYLSYVATWGFWLSLFSLPLFGLLGFGLPTLIESGQPTRYYVLIDESAAGRFDAAVQAEFDQGRQMRAREALRAAGRMVADEARIEAAVAALEARDGLDGLPDALRMLGLPADALPLDSLAGRYVRVAAPGAAAEDLRPYLMGEMTMSTPEGLQPLFAVVVIRPDGAGAAVDYWSANLTDDGLKNQVTRAVQAALRRDALLAEGVAAGALAAADALRPAVRELHPSREAAEADVRVEERLPLYMGIALAFMLWTVVFSVVNMLLTALIEEKGGKILEVLLASARYHEILTGKLLGVAAVSATLLLFWGGLGAVTLIGVQQFAQAADLPVADILGALFDPALLLPAAGYFVVGYLMFGSVFLAVGSLCETLQEAQTLMGPLLLIMMAPLFIVMTALNSLDSPFLAFASWVPFWTPFVMMARLPAGVPPAEIAATTALMLATMTAIIWAAAVVFRQGALGRADAGSVRKLLRFGRKAKG
ncbi:MAG: ABC transporter permease [Maricaulaceae bacterium]|nr:ABC transporter permease [Maricaulaceae bacterium]